MGNIEVAWQDVIGVIQELRHMAMNAVVDERTQWEI